jgi:CubicO group peptidase (beta-lactamase class C family)
MKKILICSFLVFNLAANSQTYFPPLSGTTWDTLAPSNLGWCADSITSLYNFLDEKHTKGFIILKDGKIVLEKYFGTFTKDSNWYWASAGKSLTSVMVGIAQDNNLININNPVSNYLGAGWTVEPSNKEQLITVKNLLSMNSGLSDTVVDNDCTIDTCLQYYTDAGNRWAYHNAAYYKLFDVLTTTSGSTINALTNATIKSKIGMQGLWLAGSGGYGHIYYSTARSMARFGLMVSNNCIWNSDTILKNNMYKYDMQNTSQVFNKSYGYLWWLNGKNSYMPPGIQLTLNTNLVPTAPADMFAAMGKNDQRVFIVPSQQLVVVRMGDAADGSAAAISPFDEQLWAKISSLTCIGNAINNNLSTQNNISVYPNPFRNQITIESNAENNAIELFSIGGEQKYRLSNAKKLVSIPLETLTKGIYFLKISNEIGVYVQKIIKE